MGKYKRLIRIGLACIILLLILQAAVPVYADVGPKPSLTITVRGLSTDTYWLDLLVTDEPNFSWLDISDAERAQISKLAEYQDEEGFHPALLKGTRVPLHGTLQRKSEINGTYIHKFSYVGVPRTFKIAILTDNGTLLISEVVNRKQFASEMLYDVSGANLNGTTIMSVGKVTEGMYWSKFGVSLLISIILTLIIEIELAAWGGFTSKKSFKVLLITNILTQIILNAIVLHFDHSLGKVSVPMAIILGEFIVILIEALVYSTLLTEQTVSRRVVYAIKANLASILLGCFLFFI